MHELTARLWTAYLGMTAALTAADVDRMLALAKIAGPVEQLPVNSKPRPLEDEVEDLSKLRAKALQEQQVAAQKAMMQHQHEWVSGLGGGTYCKLCGAHR